jgi:hypothetical protein
MIVLAFADAELAAAGSLLLSGKELFDLFLSITTRKYSPIQIH